MVVDNNQTFIDSTTYKFVSYNKYLKTNDEMTKDTIKMIKINKT